MSIVLSSDYLTLPDIFYAQVQPARHHEPKIVLLNKRVSRLLEISDEQQSTLSADFLTGQKLFSGSAPIAQAYTGHQFGHFNMLGDGRAMLLGEKTLSNKTMYDIHLKGSGITPFSRGGDGKAALAPMLREYLISEAMHHLGIPTTHSLAVCTTGESVYRENVLQGAVLTRIASSHIRVGTFQFARALNNKDFLEKLLMYTLKRHFPDTLKEDNLALALLRKVVDKQAYLISKWMLMGFVHGVMNTDNMTISGETIDYGPCAFMNQYDPETVFSSIDQNGRYAYGNQPKISQWNLARLAEALLPLVHDDAQKAIRMIDLVMQQFASVSKNYWLAGMRKKLGLINSETEDEKLIQTLLDLMLKNKADYASSFRALSLNRVGTESLLGSIDYLNWRKEWSSRILRQPIVESEVYELMKAHNPAVIPRNHKVEEALSAATEKNDLSYLHRALEAISRPFDTRAGFEDWESPPATNETCYKTFCGT